VRALLARSLRSRVLLALCLAASCKPSAGSSCEKGEARCLDSQRELICQIDKFIETPCRGPGGCSTSEKGTSCDFSGNKPGDPCSTDDEGAATCANQDGMLACHAGRYELLPCRGTRGCVNADGRASCDTSLAEAGDPCHDANLKACSRDGSQVLSCQQGRMQRMYACRGKNGCGSSGGRLACDSSVAELGDLCDKKLEGQAFACTPDSHAVLLCKAGAFTLDESCKLGTRCTLIGSSTQCAKPGK